jgi:MFS family permease
LSGIDPASRGQTSKAATEAEPRAGGISHAWSSLRHRNFRLFFGGQSISLIGSWLTRAAKGWLVYRLTGSALKLGTVGFAGQIPTFLLAPFAGVWVDRLDRRKVLVCTETLSMIQALALAWMTLSGRITFPWLLILSSVQGAINAFDAPARQAFMIDMVDGRRDLQNAIAVNSSMVNVARLIGPALGGILIAAAGEGWCFFLDGISYLAMIAALLAMRLHAPAPRRQVASMLAGLKAGWSYVSQFLPIRTILLLFAVVSLMGMPYMVLMPVFAKKVLGGGPHTLGFLMSAAGLGALAAALSLAARKSVAGLVRIILISTAVSGLGLIGFGISRLFWLSVVMALVAGMALMECATAGNILIQAIVSEDKRGRVMSYYTVAAVGMAPFGSLLAGTMAHAIGAPRTVMASGLAVLAAAAWFATRRPALRREIRPIYREMGILPAKEGVQP